LLIKAGMRTLSEKHDRPLNEQTLPLLAALAAHEENAQRKRSIQRRTPSCCFLKKRNRRTDNETRREVINDITKHKKTLTESKTPLTKREENRINRKAVEAVLEKRSYIRVVENEPVSPLL